MSTELHTITWSWTESDQVHSLVGTPKSCKELFTIFQMGFLYSSIAFARVTVAASGDYVLEHLLDPDQT